MVSKIYDPIELCRLQCRDEDPDRYFISLFGPSHRRKWLWVLLAFNSEISRIRETTRELMIGRIRLQWWREGVEEAAGICVREHHILQALSQLLITDLIDKSILDRILDAREQDLLRECFEDFEQVNVFVQETSGLLALASAQIIGYNPDNTMLAQKIGTAWGLIGLVRSATFHFHSGKSYLPGCKDLHPNPFISSAGVITQMVEKALQLVEEIESDPSYLSERMARLYVSLIKSDIAIARSLVGQNEDWPKEFMFKRQLQICYTAWFGAKRL